jgi:hypothetical protein
MIFKNLLIIDEIRGPDTNLSLSRLADAPELSTLNFKHME